MQFQSYIVSCYHKLWLPESDVSLHDPWRSLGSTARLRRTVECAQVDDIRKTKERKKENLQLSTHSLFKHSLVLFAMHLNGTRFGALLLILLQSLQLVQAVNLLQASGLTQCSDSSQVTVNNFKAVFTPGNQSVSIDFDGFSEVAGDVYIDVDLLVYGYKALTKTFDPCSLDLTVFCPMKAIELQIPTISQTLGDNVLSQIPCSFLPP
jgi:hypothetical protein